MDTAAISGIKKTAKACAYVREQLAKWIRPGVTTLEIDSQAVNFIKETGAVSAVLGRNNFPGHICICLNEEVAHYSGGNRLVNEGDLVKIDVSLRYEGWVADCAETIYLGSDERLRSLVEANKSAIIETAQCLCPGLPLRDISAVIDSQKGSFYFFDELTGHGTGPSLHCQPILPSFRDDSLSGKTKTGQILAIEAVYGLVASELQFVDNLRINSNGLNCHHEETIMITANGCNILTR